MAKPSVKRDLILIAVLCLIAAALYAGGLFLRLRPAARVVVKVDGRKAAAFDLGENIDYQIPGYAGGVNHLIIQDGQAWISEASCPDKLCVRQGRISRTGEIIICLPNRVTAEIVSP